MLSNGAHSDITHNDPVTLKAAEMETGLSAEVLTKNRQSEKVPTHFKRTHQPFSQLWGDGFDYVIQDFLCSVRGIASSTTIEMVIVCFFLNVFQFNF